MSPEELVGLLADADRLAAVSALALGARTNPEIVERTGIDGKRVSKAVTRLAKAGLVGSDADGLVLHAHLFADAARAAAPPKQYEDHGYADPKAEATLRAFVRDGQLTGMPAQPTRRRLVLEHVARSFEPGVHYPERAVTELLEPWCAAGATDHVTLRRYLVDEGLLSREGGEYWRSGGPVD
ncbi:hypothetical protein EV186_1011677 [Labedaea rhizosphaerae]|uniref:DUF2087 domain-containing protein n=2 Tax=Labedaea rhizosphaerae TaxID=598644 RepID=A0A4R6SNJ4_LABRH|nr:hypothetical protein EV186_1011677 [Labedaea rhizosphaerae]